ncbi:hypothetical protein BHE74_00009330 [Ensete ventricosum]|uniref:Uncharacterized protein n=1 Tax=Ensete ventricosum TaxID=4639 RepID=A0A427ARX6_ENSVE|nr:hypothetical protein B296_00024129 [Ensete ventricosum]RWW21125.1 hypothetical protein GW17_00014735 [Ensete ventricosum]RWW82225.1 hypothetical protein BHE74_00009330 [Ensete ventricosum]
MSLIDEEKMNMHQALQLGQDANSPNGFFNGQRCQMCLRTDPLQKVMEKLANPGMYDMGHCDVSFHVSVILCPIFGW